MNKVLRRLALGLVAGALSVMLVTSAAFAAVDFDVATGEGFVGKGDVQLALGLNNKQLQDSASAIQFRALSTTVSEQSWVCTNDKNENTQLRERTTTTITEGVVSSVARERNQVTGFILNGYAGAPSTLSEADGPKLNSCPSSWSLTTAAGDPVVDPDLTSSTIEVSSNGSTWVAI